MKARNSLTPSIRAVDKVSEIPTPSKKGTFLCVTDVFVKCPAII